jgi:hypothetical protein
MQALLAEPSDVVLGDDAIELVGHPCCDQRRVGDALRLARGDVGSYAAAASPMSATRSTTIDDATCGCTRCTVVSTSGRAPNRTLFPQLDGCRL